MTLLAKSLSIPLVKSACADKTKKKHFAKQSVIKSYLKIVADLLHGGKHAVNKMIIVRSAIHSQ